MRVLSLFQIAIQSNSKNQYIKLRFRMKSEIVNLYMETGNYNWLI